MIKEKINQLLTGDKEALRNAEDLPSLSYDDLRNEFQKAKTLKFRLEKGGLFSLGAVAGVAGLGVLMKEFGPFAYIAVLAPVAVLGTPVYQILGSSKYRTVAKELGRREKQLEIQPNFYTP